MLKGNSKILLSVYGVQGFQQYIKYNKVYPLLAELSHLLL